MAQQEANQIIQALQAGLGIRQRRQELERQSEQEQQRIDIAKAQQESQEALRKSEIDRFNKNYELQQKQLDLSRQMQDLQRDQVVQKATENYLQTGVPFPSDQIMPGLAPNSGPLAGLATPTVTHNIPGIGSFETVTPEVFTQQQVARQEALNAPAEKKQAAIQASQAEQRLKEIQLEHTMRLQEEAQRQQYETQRTNTELRARASMDAQNNARAIQAAMISATGGLLGMPGSTSDPTRPSMPVRPGNVQIKLDASGKPMVQSVDPTQIIQNRIDSMYNGTLTSDELKKQVGAKQAEYITNLASQRGVVPLTKEQATQLKDLNDVAKAGPIIKDMAILHANNSGFGLGNIWNPLSDSGRKFAQDEQELGKYLPAISRVLANVHRFNNKEIERYQQALQPSKVPWSTPTNGIDKYNSFINDLQNDYNTVLGTLPDGQRANLIKQGGGTSLPFLNKSLFQPGISPGTPSGMTPPVVGLPGLGAPANQ